MHPDRSQGGPNILWCWGRGWGRGKVSIGCNRGWGDEKGDSGERGGYCLFDNMTPFKPKGDLTPLITGGGGGRVSPPPFSVSPPPPPDALPSSFPLTATPYLYFNFYRPSFPSPLTVNRLPFY